MTSSFHSRQQRTILIVDDDLDMLELNRTLLEHYGYKVVTAQTGKKALYLLNQTPSLHLILLDYNLTDMKGDEFLKIFEEKNQKLFSQVPVVFHSAESEIPTSKAIGFIQKSPNIQSFLLNVDKYATPV